MLARKTIDWCHELAARKDGYFRGEKYEGSGIKHPWQCKYLHPIWWATPAHIKSGTWCPICAGRIKLSIESYHKLATLHDGFFRGDRAEGVLVNAPWQCKYLHPIWWATLHNIQRRNSWCPYCAGNALLTIGQCRDRAAERGGACLSKEYINAKTKLLWQCADGHTWWATPDHIQGRRWCPRCEHRHSQGELDIYRYVQKLFQDALSGQRKLLKNKNFELDIYIPSLKKAIEFDGTFWHTSSWAIRHGAPARDASKTQQCLDAGIDLLRIPEKEYTQGPQAVFAKIDAFLAES